MSLKFLCSYFILFSLSLGLTQDSLIKMSQNSQCIKAVVDSFIKKESCQKLLQSQKSLLAIKMTNCLNIKLGKKPIEQCEDLERCSILGDDWNTFTAFYTHIDNLCHFYWDLVKHERNSAMINGLSDSAFLAQDILKKNYQSTQDILQTQQKINQFMSQSLVSNQILAQTLKNSENKIQNMTNQIQNFLGQLNVNLISQYSSIIQTISTINEGIQQMNSIQVIMASQIDSISGILYFIVQLVIILLITSFGQLKKCRNISFTLFLLNILCEMLLPSVVIFFLTIKHIRTIFVLAHFATYVRMLFKKQQNFQRMKHYWDGRLDTQRIKRIFRQMIEEKKQTCKQKYENTIN